MATRLSTDIYPAAPNPARPPSALSGLAGLRWDGIHWEGLLAIIVTLLAWETASRVLPPFLFPSLATIAQAVIDLYAEPEALLTVAQSYARIILWLGVAFVLSTSLGVIAAQHDRIDRALHPLIQLKQGIPGICWAIFAIIWFEGMEVRIAFVVIVSTLPSLFFQARDGFRAIPHDLREMVRALRPTAWQMATKLTLPGISPALITGLRINLGAAARVTITAELLAGISGIGHALRTAQEQFRMDAVLAWTLAIVIFVLVTDFAMSRLERRQLRWRQRTEEAA